jgi:glycosyltransferase involved in cell wall biosynthesis
MIALCELNFSGRSHVPVNAGLLATIDAAFPKDPLYFYGCNTHIEELKNEVSQEIASSITWKTISPPTYDSSYFKRFMSELSILRRLVGTLATQPTARLVLTSAHPSTLLALKLARWIEQNPVLVHVVLHGMSGVVGKRFRHPIRRFQDMKTALTILGNKGIHYIVLEQTICDTVLRNFPLLLGKIDTLEHPISPSQGELPAIQLAEPIRFGFLGLADKPKGFPVFVEMANHITAQFGTRVEFHAIGHLPKNSGPMSGTSALCTSPQSGHMSRASFLEAIACLHFIVLPHEPGRYTLAASGVLLDAFACGKPVIARKIPIFESMFKKHGDIGYLFNDDHELKSILERIVKEPDKCRYQCQIQHLRSARKLRHPQMLAEVYRDICKRTAQPKLQ